jgi:hypothetical protein
MKNRERFMNALNFRKVDDRLPMIEWATWWDKTINRWRTEGLPSDMEWDGIGDYLGLDMQRQFWLRPCKGSYYSEGTKIALDGMEAYEKLKEHLFPREVVERQRQDLEKLKALHDNGDVVVWITLEGFFWFPRTLLGIEQHLYTFYDQPELMHRMNEDLTEYHLYCIEEFCKILKPDFMTFAEDMSYNLGPMLSKDLFDEFLLPYYKRVVPVLKKYGIVPIVDTDGNLESMIPWLIEAGIEGALPLERQAGVDVNRIRANYPEFRIIGGYDKMVMDKGEAAMRAEFERILPAMKSGGYIPSCDHQTPPAVSLEDYRLYLQLFEEYSKKAVE